MTSRLRGRSGKKTGIGVTGNFRRRSGKQTQEEELQGQADSEVGMPIRLRSRSGCDKQTQE